MAEQPTLLLLLNRLTSGEAAAALHHSQLALHVLYMLLKMQWADWNLYISAPTKRDSLHH